VHVLEDKTVFTGDILFIEGHPIMWNGPIKNWVAACERMLAMDIDTVVPGHGPITDKRGVKAVRDYLVYITDEARKRFAEGMSFYDAAMDISLTDYSSWGDSERIVVNVAALYREFAGDSRPPDMGELTAMMAALHKRATA
jgi:glyoxylase-like metal-dependent hydrolase (beta-lactamase superfamily II)